MSKRLLSTVVLSLSFVVALSLSACGSLDNNKESSSLYNLKISSSTVNVSNSTSSRLNVKLSSESVIEDGKAKFKITTNLPEGTVLVVSLSGIKSDYRAQQNVTVKDGKTETSLFSSNNKHLDYGTYDVNISTPLDISIQPASVQSVFGNKGANLTGDQVLKDPVRVHCYNELVINEYSAGVSIPSSLPSQSSSTSVPNQKPLPAIWMTEQQVMDSTWGKPQKINKTTTARNIHEQWCYPNCKYIYFDNGVVTGIQE